MISADLGGGEEVGVAVLVGGECAGAACEDGDGGGGSGGGGGGGGAAADDTAYRWRECAEADREPRRGAGGDGEWGIAISLVGEWREADGLAQRTAAVKAGHLLRIGAVAVAGVAELAGRVFTKTLDSTVLGERTGGI